MTIHRWSGALAMIALTATFACGDDETQMLGTSTSATTGAGGNGGSTTTMNGGSGAVGGMAMMTGGGGTTGTGGSPAGYPEGPYGKTVGETFPFLSWQGYISTDPAALATTETWTDTYTSLDLHGSGAQYALIHTTLSG